MRWLLWGFLTGSTALASYAVAAALYPERGRAHRLAAALLIQLSLIIAALELASIGDHLEAGPLSAVALALSALLGFGATRQGGVAGLRARLRADLILGTLADATWRDVLWLIPLGPALLAAGVVLKMVVCLRTWAWDAAWYHQPITAYTIQNHGLSWINTGVNFIAGYPKNVELVAVWNCLLPGSSRLDDSPQLPFVALGMLLTVAWIRRLGGSRAMAAGLAVAFICLPPIFVQASSNENDIACGVLLAGAVYFLSDTLDSRNRWLALLAVGLYVGTKYTGAFHALLLAPVFGVLFVLQVLRAEPKRRGLLVLDGVGSVAAALGVGIFKYVQNALHTGNPVWPIKAQLPVLGTLNGPEDPAKMAFTGLNSYFFSRTGDFTRFLHSWTEFNATPEPNIRGGGFGPAFLPVMVPCLVALAVYTVVRKRYREGVPVIALFILANVVPGAWWPRYTDGGAIAGLVSVGAIGTALASWAVPQAVLAVVFAVLVAVGQVRSRRSPNAFPRTVETACSLSAADQLTLQADPINWPTALSQAYQAHFQPGDVISYDLSASFPSEFFASDYRTDVEFVPVGRDPSAYPELLRSLNVRWAMVAHHTLAERALQAAGYQELARLVYCLRDCDAPDLQALMPTPLDPTAQYNESRR